MMNLSDEQAREIRAYLIDKSWESSELFDPFQAAWNAIAAILGVTDIEDNGHGKVRWAAQTKKS
jgi:hypothetical protein